jgi:hypothetical protein
MILIVHFPYFTAVQLFLKRVRVLRTEHLFTVLPKPFWLYNMYQVLLLSALEFIEQGGD